MQRQEKNLWLESAFIVAIVAGLVNYIISQNSQIAHLNDQVVHCGELRTDDMKYMFEASNKKLNDVLTSLKNINLLRIDSIDHNTDLLKKHLKHIIKKNGYEIN